MKNELMLYVKSEVINLDCNIKIKSIKDLQEYLDNLLYQDKNLVYKVSYNNIYLMKLNQNQMRLDDYTEYLYIKNCIEDIDNGYNLLEFTVNYGYTANELYNSETIVGIDALQDSLMRLSQCDYDEYDIYFNVEYKGNIIPEINSETKFKGYNQEHEYLINYCKLVDGVENM